MAYLETLNSAVENIIQNFQHHTIKWEIHEFGGTLHAFFIKPENIEYLKSDWENITSAIAGNFQAQLESEFEIWNVYLFFILPHRVDPAIKYKIENDTFSSRKIIIESDDSYKDILANHIFNTNLETQKEILEITTSSALTFEYNPIIYNIVRGKTLKSKKRTAEAETAFDKLVKALKEKL